MRVVVVRHHEEDSPGFLADAFAARGARVETHLFPEGGSLPDAAGADHVVVLGADHSVNDPYPWIEEELRWLRDLRTPVLGICFGAQALARAFGGRVEKAAAPEIGWVTVRPRRAPGLGVRIEAGPWLQFHGDRCVLPTEATLLAENDAGVQAFVVGRHLGVQFHPEVDAAQLAGWLEHGGREAALAAGRDPEALLAETAAREPEAARRADSLVGTCLAHAARPAGAVRAER